jgi:hypothetical protein
MSNEQRILVQKVVEVGFKSVLLVLGFLATYTFTQIRDDIHQLSSDVTSIKERLIRVETKIEDAEKYRDDLNQHGQRK